MGDAVLPLFRVYLGIAVESSRRSGAKQWLMISGLDAASLGLWKYRQLLRECALKKGLELDIEDL